MVTEVQAQPTEREEILSFMQKMATEGKPVQAGDVVHRGDDDLDAQMVVGKIIEPGVMTIYDTRTAEPSLTSRHMLALQLTKIRPDGSQVFSVHPPRDANGNIIRPKRGKLKCLLHADGPNRALYDTWGLLTCTKSNLPSIQQVKNHMRKRHQQEWEAIESDRLEREHQEDRDIQRRNAEGTVAALAAATGQERPEGRRSRRNPVS